MFGFLTLHRAVYSSVYKLLQSGFSKIPSLPSKIGTARVECTVRQTEFGRVLYQGVSWQARCIRDMTCFPETRVQVMYQQNSSLTMVRYIAVHTCRYLL